MTEILGGRYQILAELGRNPGRRTYRVKDLKTGDDCVLKRVSFGEDMAWQDFQAFEREAQVLQALDHPAIPKYRDGFEVELPTGQGFALVQDFIDAPSLETLMAKGYPWTEKTLKLLATQLLDVLDYLHLHAPPVIHRDIKPSNLLWETEQQQAYLVDFGAVQTAKVGSTRTVVGTYGYMPPEQFGDRAVPASDLYALGATLIHLATGQHPADLPQKEQRLQFQGLVNLSPSFSYWLQQLTEPALEKRLGSAPAALKALNDHLTCPTIAEKPAHSKLIWRETPEQLEVIIPPVSSQGLRGQAGLLFLGAFAVAWNTFILFWTGFALLAPFPINLVFTIFSLPFWLAGIGLAVTVLFGFFGQVRLTITPEDIQETYHLFGFRKHVAPPSPRDSISKVEYHVRHFTKDSDGDRVTVQPELMIWAGTRQYQLGGKGLLSDPEIEWLGDALSQYLQMPLQVKEPLSKSRSYG